MVSTSLECKSIQDSSGQQILLGPLVIQLKLALDARGHFTEWFHQRLFREANLPVEFVQDNFSLSVSGVIRGLHYQFQPAQGKLVGVLAGAIWDVLVDLRAGSPTYGKHAAVELNDSNGKLLWIPPGFGHGFCVLGTQSASVFYKVTAHYEASGEGGICWNDPSLAISWPVKTPLVSQKDSQLQTFSAYQKNPAFQF